MSLLGAWREHRDEDGAPLTAQRREVGVGDRARVAVWAEYERQPGGAEIAGYRWAADSSSGLTTNWRGWQPVAAPFGREHIAAAFLDAKRAADRAALRLGWTLDPAEVTALSLAEIKAARAPTTRRCTPAPRAGATPLPTARAARTRPVRRAGWATSRGTRDAPDEQGDP